MTYRASLSLTALAAIAAVTLTACGSSSSSSHAAPASSASAPASAVSASQAAATTGNSADAAAEAKACAELDTWQKAHGDSAAPSQDVSSDLMSAPDPLSSDFFTWDLAVGTSQPDAQDDLLKVFTDCAKAEAEALGG